MRKYIVLLAAFFLLVSPVTPDGCGVTVMPVLADSGPIAQGITVVQATIYQPSQGWKPIGSVPAGTQIGIYSFDGNYVRNDPDQAIEKKFVRVYGKDMAPETQWGSPVLGQAGSPIQVGEVVYAGSNCGKYPYPGLGQYGAIPRGTSLKVANKMVAAYDGSSYLFVWVNQRTNEPAWVKESDVQRKVAVATDSNASFDWDNVVLVAMPLASHLAGNGRTIAVTVAQAEAAVRVALQGAGVLYTRSDGRILIDVVRSGYRYVGFIDSKTGELASFFPPAERYQVAGQVNKAAQYISNVVQKGGYHRIRPDQVPDWIKNKWLGASPLALLRAFVQSSEVCAVLMVMPQDQLQGLYGNPRADQIN